MSVLSKDFGVSQKTIEDIRWLEVYDRKKAEEKAKRQAEEDNLNILLIWLGDAEVEYGRMSFGDDVRPILREIEHIKENIRQEFRKAMGW